jgi:aminopeptidase-like protein/aminoglycoside N3'-acetyltransferase
MGTSTTTGSSSARPVTDPALSRADLAAALRDAGLAAGDVAFVHVDLTAIGLTGAPIEPRCADLLGALHDVLGAAGTLLVPTYTFSFCRQEVFDTDNTPAGSGPWSRSQEFLELVRRQPDALRSIDPIHSVAALGRHAAALVDAVPPTCFGPGSVQSRLREVEGRICAIGVGLHESTMVHHAETMMGVPFRYKKLFTGTIIHRGQSRRLGWSFDVRIASGRTELDAASIDALLREAAIAHRVPLGADWLSVVDARAFYEVLCHRIAADPWVTVVGPPAHPIAVERERCRTVSVKAAVASEASLSTLVEALWPLRRDIVSDGYDAALAALASQMAMQVHEYPSGTEAFTWVVPEKWTCHEAWLETIDGRRLFSYADHPLHVVSYSLPFEGVVSRDTLMAHLHVHDRLPDALPFVFKYYERDWGLCCSRRLRDTLQDPAYRVVIRSTFSYGTLKVGEIVVRGKSDDAIVLCAHLCHPGMAVDDLTGVVVGLDVMRQLRRRTEATRYTYRLLILPETIGSLAWLSAHRHLIPQLKGGLFLEMLGLPHPHVLQHSYDGTSEADRCFAAAVRAAGPDGWTAPYRTLVGNDERQFNAPGIRVPMAALLRVLPPAHPDYPYREYHSSHDTPALVTAERLQESRNLVLKMLDTLERNLVPVNQYAGEICCSRFGLHVDWRTEPELHRSLFTIMDRIDGDATIVDIAEACGISFDSVCGFVDTLAQKGLVTYALPARGPEHGTNGHAGQ